MLVSLRVLEDGEDGVDYIGRFGGRADPESPVPQGVGDLLLRVWTGSGWQVMRTAASGDARSVSVSGGEVVVAWRGRSGAVDGLDGVEVESAFRFGADGALEWRFTVRNAGSAALEIGELSMPFTTNTGVREIFEGSALDPDEGQTEWHERRVLQHLFIGGHASYALLQRPSGQSPALLVHMLDDTALEVAYQMDPAPIGQWGLEFEGPYYLALFSRAAREARGWLRNRERQALWFHGHRSLMLEAGEGRSFGLRFVPVSSSLEALRQELVAAGQVAVEAVPGFVVPVQQPVSVLLRCHAETVLRREDSDIGISPLELSAGLPGRTCERTG
jgi:hypothetical protein